MAKIGRNDPCPCGSGKKYKKCCLAKDEAEARASHLQPSAPTAAHEPSAGLPASPGLVGSSLTAPIEPPEIPESIREANERWDRFEAADREGRVAIFRELLGRPEIGPSEATDMLEEIRSESTTPEQRQEWTQLVANLKEESPAVYRDQAGWINGWLIDDAVADGEYDRLPELLEPFVEQSDRSLDEFFRAAHCLMYHGQAKPVLAAARQIWPAIDSSTGTTPWGIEEFCYLVATLTCVDYLESAASPRPDDARLTDALERLGGVDVEQVQQDVASFLAAPPGSLAFETKVLEELQASVRRLSFEWLGDLRRHHGIPLSKGELARVALTEYLNQRINQKLRGSKLLLPDPKAFDTFLAKRVGFLIIDVFEAGTLVELLPRYLDFLVQRGLVDPSQRSTLAITFKSYDTNFSRF